MKHGFKKSMQLAGGLTIRIIYLAMWAVNENMGCTAMEFWKVGEPKIFADGATVLQCLRRS
jgi:hypothetical protein